MSDSATASAACANFPGRLLFLDQTLQGMIQRFEDEYPECRLHAATPSKFASATPGAAPSPPASTVPVLVTTGADPGPGPEPGPEPDAAHDSDADEDAPATLRSRHNSDVSLASRALAMEEGQVHRLGHRVRAEILQRSSRPPSPSPAPGSAAVSTAAAPGSAPARADTPSDAASPPAPGTTATADAAPPQPVHALANKLAAPTVPFDLQALIRQAAATSGGGGESRGSADLSWEAAFNRVAENAAELKKLERENPDEFGRFRESQIAALRNRQLGGDGASSGRAEAEAESRRRHQGSG